MIAIGYSVREHAPTVVNLICGPTRHLVPQDVPCAMGWYAILLSAKTAKGICDRRASNARACQAPNAFGEDLAHKMLSGTPLLGIQIMSIYHTGKKEATFGLKFRVVILCL